MEQELRQILSEIGRRVWQKNFVASNDGNFSFRLSEDRVLCTPTMVSKGFMKPEDMVIVDLDGTPVNAGKRSTSEIKLHLYIYQQRPAIKSVVHVHPPHATAFAIARRELPKCVLPEVEVLLGEIPMAPYQTTGTWEFAHSIAPWVRTHDCILLTNHGAVTMGQDPFDAFYKMETLDQYCRILLLAKQVGDWNQIDVQGMQDLMRLKERFGLPDPRSPEALCDGGMPSQAAAPDSVPSERFVPHSGPIVDSPKVAKTTATTPATEGTASAPWPDDVRRIVEEVVRRMTN